MTRKTKKIFTKAKKKQRIVVPFIKRSDKSKLLIQKLFNLSTMSSRTSTQKKNAMRMLHKILVTEQSQYLLFLQRYKKYVASTLNIDISEGINIIVNKYEEIALAEGQLKSVKMFKQIYDLLLRFSTSNEITPIPFLKSDKDGIPKFLGIISKWIRGTVNERRAALSCVQVIKLIRVEDPVFNTDSIRREQFVPKLAFGDPPEVGNYFRKFSELENSKPLKCDLNRLSRSYKLALENMFPAKYQEKRLESLKELNNLHMSARNGPNGPSLTTTVCDWDALMSDKSNGGKLLTNIYNYSQLVDNSQLLGVIRSFLTSNYTVAHKDGRKTCHSRLALKREAWGKTRTFAICDYFSQSCLLGLHCYLFKWLRKQPEDGTFNQDRVSEMVKEWTKSDQIYSESADLTTATDSIPVEIQGEILTQIFGPKLATYWVGIVADRTFLDPDGNEIRYQTGQPMGILSSWACLAVWHHVMVRTSMIYLNIRRDLKVPRYCVIGDDVAMQGSDLFNVYEELVSTMQGIGISKVKGYHKETQTLKNPFPDNNGNYLHTAELAKRVFCNGVEITVVPSDEVKTSFEDSFQFTDLLYSLKKRGYPEIQMTHLPTLTSISRDMKSALVLATCPLIQSPPYGGNLDDKQKTERPWNSVPWFQEWFQIDIYRDELTYGLLGMLQTTFNNTLDSLTNWSEYQSVEEIKVKGWVIVSNAQSYIFDGLITRATELFESAYSRLREEGPNNPDLIGFARDLISELYILFDVDLLLNKAKVKAEKNKRELTNSLIGKSIKHALGTVQLLRKEVTLFLE